MATGTAPHIVDEQLRDPASYLTIQRGDRVYDRYGWAAGRVVDPRITGDDVFDGLVIDFRGKRVFVDAPEVCAIHAGVVVLKLSTGDLARTAGDSTAPPCWPGGPPQAPPREEAEPVAADDAVALLAALSRMYVSGHVSLATLERNVERALEARTCAELDAIADELLEASGAQPSAAQ